jgi:heme exporter protein A
MATTPLLHTHDLCGSRGGRVLWRDLSLQLQPGEARWLRGANGSGKTTLLRTLAGLRQPDSGRVERGVLRYLGHAPGVPDALTPAEHLAFAAQLQGGATAQAQAEALQRWGAKAWVRRPARTLSQGQRRRAALAVLALPQSAGTVWLLDEPFDALDTEGVATLAALMSAHAAAGGAVLFTCHQEALAQQVRLGRDLELAA